MTPIIIVGASTRAAAWSALRAGYRPYCVDLFADTDLLAVAEVRRCPIQDYPNDLVRLTEGYPDAPLLYTGGLENHPEVVARLERRFELLGESADTLRRVRCPFTLHDGLTAAGLPALRVGREPGEVGGEVLAKPLRGTGGSGITSLTQASDSRCYSQEFKPGRPMSTLFLPGDSEPWATTRQLIGEPWLNAKPFQYCGNIGPVATDAETRARLTGIGRLLRQEFGVRGLFGVDWIDAPGGPWLTEVNPRYAASVEVAELALGRSALRPTVNRSSGNGVIGKAVLFAGHATVFPGPGVNDPNPVDPWRLPAVADVPTAGENIEPGHPIMTIFARGRSAEECEAKLRRLASTATQ